MVYCFDFFGITFFVLYEPMFKGSLCSVSI